VPVLATITAITLLRGGAGSPGPFFDPEKMREMLTDGLEDHDDDRLKRALTLLEYLESKIERYRVEVGESSDAYIEEMSNPETDATDLIARLEPIDRERRSVLESVIDFRRQLMDVLDDSSWAAVFH
jgi:hypothetical protein